MGVKNKIGDLDEICKKILKVDTMIRFTAILSEKGRVLAAHKKEGVKLLVNEKQQEMLFMQVALEARMHKEYDEQLGKIEFISLEREKIIMLGFSFESYVIYLTTEKGIDLIKVTSEILQMIKMMTTK